MKKGIKEMPKDVQVVTQEQINGVKLDFSKNYQWQHTDEFGMTGKEFEIIFNALLGFVSTPFSLENTMKVAGLYNLMEQKFKVGVLIGKITEVQKAEELKEQVAEIPETSGNN